jgi:hypothetical protein
MLVIGLTQLLSGKTSGMPFPVEVKRAFCCRRFRWSCFCEGLGGFKKEFSYSRPLMAAGFKSVSELSGDCNVVVYGSVLLPIATEIAIYYTLQYPWWVGR